MGHVKQASADEIKVAADLLEKIRAENPEHWPHGLTVDHFDPGDLFLIRKEAGAPPIGFVGWQERSIGHKKVGFYSIGLLPEERGQGVASKAVAQLLEKKASGVDLVAALVVDGNIPSEKLAARLGIPVLAKTRQEKVAGPLPLLARLALFAERNPVVARAGMGLLGGSANAFGYDTLMPRQEGLTFMQDKPRAFTFLLNAVAGSVGGGKNLVNILKAQQFKRIANSPALWAQVTRQLGSAPRSAVRGADMRALFRDFVGIPLVKVPIGMAGQFISMTGRNASEANRIAEMAANAQNQIATAGAAAKSFPPWALLTGAGLLTAGLGYGAHSLAKSIREKAEAPITLQQRESGRLRVTLPTKNPSDAETVLDLPFDQNMNLSTALQNRLGVDVRRRLRAETQQRYKRLGTTLDQQVN